MTMNIIYLKTGLKSALAIVIPKTLKEETDPMELEFTPIPVTVSGLAFDLEQKITKGKKKLTPNKNHEDKADRDA